MISRYMLPLAAAAAFLAVMLGPANLIGQAPATKAKAPAKGKTYKAPRTPWGDPDLQGLWPGSVNIPLQRTAAMGERAVLTAAEIVDRDKAAKQRFETGTWIEFYPSNDQASLIVDPKNGRLPPMTPAAEKRNKEMRDGLGPPTLGGVDVRADSYTDFDLWGRCITKGLIGSMLPGNLYNKGNRIVQGPGYVVIQNEMVHESRVIPLDGRPHSGPAVRTYMGDGRGHWEGDTLVVETTNFLKEIGMNGIGNALLTEELKITERFTRTSATELSYDATIDDSGTWTRPWTMHVPYELEPYDLYEYACHEANYGLADILKGARADEKRKAQAK